MGGGGLGMATPLFDVACVAVALKKKTVSNLKSQTWLFLSGSVVFLPKTFSNLCIFSDRNTISQQANQKSKNAIGVGRYLPIKKSKSLGRTII